MANIKTPLRYPGGKSRAINTILQRFPEQFLEFREPFVGGGSVFLAVRQHHPKARVWINDLNPDLIAFWQSLQTNSQALMTKIRRVRETQKDGSLLFKQLRSSFNENLTDFDRAVRFFILNRITFSGTVDSGGYSQQAFDGRFTESSIDRLAKVAPLLAGVKITNLDYQQVTDAAGKDVFIFLDPPYFGAIKSKLYGKNGDLHTHFDHARFSMVMQQCQHPWLITYDDCLEIRQQFEFAHLENFTVQYGMNNYMQEKAAKGAELFISHALRVPAQASLFT